jgi:outer membrane protein OmpA-like peptidoglycan-associated protein
VSAALAAAARAEPLRSTAAHDRPRFAPSRPAPSRPAPRRGGVRPDLDAVERPVGQASGEAPSAACAAAPGRSSEVVSLVQRALPRLRPLVVTPELYRNVARACAPILFGARARAAAVWLVAGAALALAIAAPVRADAPAAQAETWLVGFEGSGALAVSTPQRDLFGPGGAGGVAVFRTFAPALASGLRLRAGALSDGAAPADPGRVDPGAGGMLSLVAAFRLRLPGLGADPASRITGPFLEAGVGGMLTGDVLRVTAEVSAGWLFRVGPVALGPALRYVQVVEETNALDTRDARLVLGGVELWFFDPRSAPPPPPPPRPSDRDGDGIVDEDDACVDDPEDHDGFEDADGCPEDDDRDGVPDAVDRCRREPEDRDGWQDEDGCPDPDNDGDGFLDPDDACPNEAEVVNGVDDHDGCPDEGLIRLVDDRVVLDETVLFDFERARIKSAARPILAAIAGMVRAHPEWTELRVEGHADTRGDEAFNRDLSERRARNVRQALVELGVRPGIIDFVGYGATRPRAMGEDEQAHAANRRVEFVVMRRHGPATQAAPSAGPRADARAGQDAATEGAR